MDERLKFIGRFLSGEKMAPLCREFGISRVTGYKIFNRYKEVGLDALYDRSRAPYRQANRLPNWPALVPIVIITVLLALPVLAIVLALGDRTVGIGGGQASRIDAVEVAHQDPAAIAGCADGDVGHWVHGGSGLQSVSRVNPLE